MRVEISVSDALRKSHAVLTSTGAEMPGIDVPPHQHCHCEVVYSSLRLPVIKSERFLEMGKGKVWMILVDFNL
jgi:hypothetical protein